MEKAIWFYAQGQIQPLDGRGVSEDGVQGNAGDANTLHSSVQLSGIALTGSRVHPGSGYRLMTGYSLENM